MLPQLIDVVARRHATDVAVERRLTDLTESSSRYSQAAAAKAGAVQGGPFTAVHLEMRICSA
eukprot:16447-Eustigmatos_ZCMA.PRE.1